MPAPVLHDEMAKRLLHLESVVRVIQGRLESIERGGCHEYLQRRPAEAQDLPNVELPIEVSSVDSIDVKKPQAATAFQQAPEPQADVLPVSSDEQSLEDDDPLQLEPLGDLGKFSWKVLRLIFMVFLRKCWGTLGGNLGKIGGQGLKDAIYFT